MKRHIFLLLIITGITAFSAAQTAGAFKQEGVASWYGKEFEGRPTASGEFFNPALYTAAHPNLPFGTILTVTNKNNMRQVTVRINDRGPFVAARIIDLSKAAAEAIDMIGSGTAPVILERAVNTTLGPVAAPGMAAPSVPAVNPVSEPVGATETAAAEKTPLLAEVKKAPEEAAVSPAKTAPETAPPVNAVIETVPPPKAAAEIAVVQPAVPPPKAAAEIAAVQPAAPPPKAAAEIAAVQPAAPPPQAALPPPSPPPQPKFYPAPPAVILGGVPPTGSTKLYRLQVGAFKVQRNAIDAFEKLKKNGLSPAYEQSGEFYRVILTGLNAAEIPVIAQTLGNSGFREALIREDVK